MNFINSTLKVVATDNIDIQIDLQSTQKEPLSTLVAKAKVAYEEEKNEEDTKEESI